MELKQGFHHAKALDVQAAKCQAEQAGYTTFVFPLEGIVDRASFFDAARLTFPLDPPILGNRSWDALSDSLWEGLYTHPSQQIAILWPNARAMERDAPAEFEIAMGVLEDVAISLADAQATCQRKKIIAVLVECD